MTDYMKAVSDSTNVRRPAKSWNEPDREKERRDYSSRILSGLSGNGIWAVKPPEQNLVNTTRRLHRHKRSHDYNMQRELNGRSDRQLMRKRYTKGETRSKIQNGHKESRLRAAENKATRDMIYSGRFIDRAGSDLVENETRPKPRINIASRIALKKYGVIRNDTTEDKNFFETKTNKKKIKGKKMTINKLVETLEAEELNEKKTHYQKRFRKKRLHLPLGNKTKNDTIEDPEAYFTKNDKLIRKNKLKLNDPANMKMYDFGAMEEEAVKIKEIKKKEKEKKNRSVKHNTDLNNTEEFDDPYYRELKSKEKRKELKHDEITTPGLNGYEFVKDVDDLSENIKCHDRENDGLFFDRKGHKPELIYEEEFDDGLAEKRGKRKVKFATNPTRISSIIADSRINERDRELVENKQEKRIFIKGKNTSIFNHDVNFEEEPTNMGNYTVKKNKFSPIDTSGLRILPEMRRNINEPMEDVTENIRH